MPEIPKPSPTISSPDPGRANLDAVLPIVYEELRSLAASYMSREGHAASLRPTALVHEAYEKLIGQRNLDPANRPSFFAAAAAIMRRVLIDHARARKADKRGGDSRPVALDSGIVDPTEARPPEPIDVLVLDEALSRLAELHARAAKVVELRYFAGLSAAEAALALGVSERLVFEDWAFAKAFLHRELRSHAL